jgi:methylated-DNA-[protein]-cysteine S-methyltransferase
VGELKLVASHKGLAAVLWQNDDPDRVRLGRMLEQPAHPVLVLAEKELGDYFAGRLRAFTVPLDFQGSQFQNSVWQALLTIPFGETRSYGDIARQIGRPSAARAVGAANGRNPISIIAPCHRVVGVNGALTGFAGGLDNKARLLGLESRGAGSAAESIRVPDRGDEAAVAPGGGPLSSGEILPLEQPGVRRPEVRPYDGSREQDGPRTL